MDLTHLESAISAGDWLIALERALEAWRDTRHPQLATLIAAVSERAGDVSSFPRARTSEAFDDAWQEVARTDPSPLATGWLAGSLGAKVPHEREERNQHLHRRVARLQEREADPRIALAVLGVLSAGKFTTWPLPAALKLYQPLVQLVRHHGDASLANAVAETAEAPRASRAVARRAVTQLLRPLAEELAARSPDTHLPQIDALLRRLLPSTGAASEGSEALLKRVYAQPADEEARLVLADAWMDEGTSRGEMVALERAGVPASDKRVKRLVRAGLASWIGEDVSSILANPVFRLGLLHQATLRPTSSASVATWKRTLTDPHLSTLRQFSIGRGSHTWYRKLVGSDALRDLRHLEVRTQALLDIVLQGAPRPLERLDFRYLPDLHWLKRLGERFESLNQLTVPLAADPVFVCSALKEAGLAGRLRTLVFANVPWYEGVVIDPWTATVERGPVLPQLGWLAENLPSLECVELRRDHYRHQMSIQMKRTEAGWILTLSANDWDRAPRVFLDGPHPLVLDPALEEVPRHLLSRAATPPAFLSLPAEVIAVHTEPAVDEGWRERLAAAWDVPVTR
jgi:uncharacterized protein (TIGR02996 family)